MCLEEYKVKFWTEELLDSDGMNKVQVLGIKVDPAAELVNSSDTIARI